MAHALTLALSPPVPSPSVQTTSPFRGIVGTTIKTFKPPLTLDLHGRILFTKNAHETSKPFCCPQSLLRELCGLDIFSFCRDFSASVATAWPNGECGDRAGRRRGLLPLSWPLLLHKSLCPGPDTLCVLHNKPFEAEQ